MIQITPHFAYIIKLLLIYFISRCASKEFEPYIDNGGTIIAFRGDGFCILAGDTRLSERYMIHSRNISRNFQVNNNAILSAAGCYADAIELKELLQSQCRKYTWDHEKIMSLTALSYTLSNVLFERRIQLPYLSHCLISGIDDNNKTCIYRYDVLGSKSNLLPNQFVCIGNGEKLIQPYLDSVMSNITNSVSNDIDYTNRQLWTVNKNDFIFEEKETNSICSDCNISCDNKTSHLQYNERNESILQSNILHTKQILLYALRSASERDITIGDGLEFVTITNKYGVEREIVSLPLH